MSGAVKETERQSEILAWDPDFTKLTPAEQRELEEARKDMKENGTVSHSDINWD